MFWKDFRTVSSIKNVSNGSYYEMDYASDYYFDDFLKVGASSDTELMHFVLQKLLKGIPINIDANQGFACSTFSITNTDGDSIFGRNLDWKTKTVPVLVHTKPNNGYESISLSNINFLGGDCDLKYLSDIEKVFETIHGILISSVSRPPSSSRVTLTIPLPNSTLDANVA